MTFADCHCHLPPEECGGSRWDQWHDQGGLAGATVAAARRQEWPALLALARRHPAFLRIAIGVHPWHLDGAGDLEEAAAELQRLLPSAAAVGEIGLDSRHAGAPSLETQYRWCRRQCELAVAADKPVVLHVCGDWAGLHRLLREFPVLRGVVHSFGGNGQIAAAILRDSRLDLSFGPRCLREDSPLAAVAAAVPLHRLLVDSDAPYAAGTAAGTDSPTPLLCREIVSRLAAARRCEPSSLAAATLENWRRLFGANSATA